MHFPRTWRAGLRRPVSLVRDLMGNKRRIARREILKAGAGLSAIPVAARADALIPLTMLKPGTPMRAYGVPSEHEAAVKRILTPAYPEISPPTGSSRTPLHLLEGIITPSGLHYERHHNGVPNIDPAEHKLLIHGLVKQPLEFSMEALSRYPRISRIVFLECAGNSGANAAPKPPQISAGALHGLISCSEWTGVPLKLLLDEAGIAPDALWILAEGSDASGVGRSIPLREAYEHGILALYQNGERLRPEQGYPLRLLMPGWEGNLNIKWLRRIKLVPSPVFTKEETSKYTQLQPDGTARQFDFIMAVKSVILRPSPGLTLRGAGYYEISGIAWSGHGRIAKVEVTRDGGRKWVEAELTAPVLPQCLVRFRLAWNWDGAPVLLQSRATDESGHVQPTHADWVQRFAPGQGYHYNAIQSWQVTTDGTVQNVHA
jgi:sulfane dehydrogenase subunit SoxC